MTEEGKGAMQQQQAKPKGMPPMKKPGGVGTAAKPRVLTAPSLAKPTTSNETDMSKSLESGTIRKALAFVTKRV